MTKDETAEAEFSEYVETLDGDRFDGDFVGSLSDPEVTSLSKRFAPTVLHDPEFGFGFVVDSVTDDDHHVISHLERIESAFHS